MAAAPDDLEREVAKLEKKEYNIFVRHSGKSVNVPESTEEEGVQLVQYQFSGTANEVFKIKPKDDGWYTIKCVVNGLFWTIKDGSDEDKAELVQMKKSKDDDQLFRIEEVEELKGMFRFRAKCSGKYVCACSTECDDMVGFWQYTDYPTAQHQDFMIRGFEL